MWLHFSDVRGKAIAPAPHCHYQLRTFRVPFNFATQSVWWSRANAPGALSAVFVGLVAWLAFYSFTPDLPGDLLAVPFAAVALVVVSLATAQRTPPRALVDADNRPLSLQNRFGVPDRRAPA